MRAATTWILDDPRTTLRALRGTAQQGLNRRTLLRRSLGLGVAPWARGSGRRINLASCGRSHTGAPQRIRIGTLDELRAAQPGPADRRRPGRTYPMPERSCGCLVDPARKAFTPGSDPVRRRSRREFAGTLPALSTPRLPAESPPRRLLVPLPVPPVAVTTGWARRPSAPGTARRRAAWTGSRSRSMPWAR